MKKTAVVLTLVLIFVSNAFSQNALVERIDKYRAKLDAALSPEGEYAGYAMVHTVNYESNVRAIGKQNTTIKFYYTQPGDSLKEENGMTEFVDIYKPPLKVSVVYNIAASQNVSIDYYSDENGNLVYYIYCTKGEYTNGEEYFYFEKGKPVKIKYVATDPDKSVLEKYKTLDKDSGFAKEELRKCAEILQKHREYNAFFSEMVKIEKRDK